MRKILVLLLVVFAPFALAQRSPSCDSAPANAQVVVPPEVAKWISIECGEGGHVIGPAPGYAWRSNMNGQPLKFPAVGPGGVPVNPKLISPHDAFFVKSRVIPIEGDFLTGTNEIAEKEKGYAGPYRKGYLLDLLSNQGFEYRLFILLVDNEPHMIHVVYQMEGKHGKRTVLVTRQ